MLFFIFSGLIAFAGTLVSASCPLELIPSRVVVRYGDSFSVNCSSSVNISEGMGWESAIGGVPLTEEVTSLPFQIDATAWVIEPRCFINLVDDQCSKDLPVTVYKTADSVSMSPPRQMVEGQKYRMQCDVANVAPAKSLSVYWRKGHQTFYTESFDKDLRQLPVNLSSVVNLTAQRDDNGTQIWCETKLDLGPSGPTLPALQSKSHEMVVLYPPTFSKPEKETVTLHGREIHLNCTAAGNPMPAYSWHVPRHLLQQKDKNQPILTTSHPGTYNCTASNTQGNKTKYFIVIQETGHPGTTAGILITVFFVFIFILGWNHTTLLAVIGVGVTLGLLLIIGGLYFVTPQGTFSFCNGSYLRGQPTSSGPI